MKRSNKAIYEQIMRNISKQVKHALNEDSTNMENIDDSDIDKVLSIYYELQDLLKEPKEYVLTGVFYRLSKILGFNDNNKLKLIEKISRKLEDYRIDYSLKLKGNIISFLFDYVYLEDDSQDLHGERISKRTGYWVEADNIHKDVYQGKMQIVIDYSRTNDPEYEWINDSVDDIDYEYLSGFNMDNVYEVFTNALIEHNIITKDELDLIYKMMENKGK